MTILKVCTKETHTCIHRYEMIRKAIISEYVIQKETTCQTFTLKSLRQEKYGKQIGD